MSDVIRVRSAEGPVDEYDAPRSLVEAEPDRYIIVDSGEKPAVTKTAAKKPAVRSKK